VADDLLIGQRIGPYELHALIGAGGMGRVYRATDTRLGREVAVKVLPSGVDADSDRLSRFDREAHLLASLNHPNIATIYGVEDHPPALILELIAGETLAERIATGPLSPPQATQIATQIVAALDSAHRKGVVHRDLKPANIKVTPDGTVKILDFGIAKMLRTNVEHAATMTSNETRVGTVIGTPAYMSPEQTRGLAVDKSTDIWAFGCVLFEMLTGQQAFGGATVSDTIAAVLERSPRWAALPPAVPVRLRRLIERCLDKDPRARLSDIADAAAALDAGHTADVDESHRRGYVIAGWTAAAAVAIAVAALSPLGRSLRLAEHPESRLVIDDLSLESAHVAFSPDGGSIVIAPRFDQRERLIVRKFDGTEPRSLAGTDGAIFPFWSPDGTAVGFFADRKLKRIDLVGETVQELADAPIGRGGAWGADGSILFAPSASGPLFRVPASGGSAVSLTALRPDQSDHRAPVILPDGRHFIFYARGQATGRGVYVANIDGSQPRRLLDAAAAAVYASTGHLLFPRENQLLAQRFDVATLTLQGDAFKVADAIGVDRGVSLSTLSASATGSIAYATASTTRNQFAWFNRSGVDVGRVGEPDNSPATNPSLSPDGRTLAFARLVDGNWDIWLMKIARGVITRFTSEPNLDFFPVWMADSRQIIYQSIRGVEADLYRRAAGVEAELLLKTPGSKVPMDISRDGRFLLYGSSTSPTNSDIWMMPLDRSEAARPLVETRFMEHGAQFSPDGRWFSYASNETGRFEIYVRPVTGSEPARRISTAGANVAQWSHRGHELFVLAPNGELMSVTMTGLPARGLTGSSISPMQSLFTVPIDPSGLSARSPFVVSPDDSRFLLPIAIDKPTPATLVVISNWHPPQ
jgi:Tol biopolymer transport system component